MTARQIKEAALRHGNAVERAAETVARRVDILRQRAADHKNAFGHPTDSKSQLLLHVVPLFPPAGGWNYAQPSVNQRLMSMSESNESTLLIFRKFRDCSNRRVGN